MNSISYEGVGQMMATFQCGEAVKMGQVVKVSNDSTVAPCAAGERIAGMAVVVRDGFASVQLSGFIAVKAAGVSTTGWVKLSADGSGGMKADEGAGTPYLVVQTDADAQTAVILL